MYVHLYPTWDLDEAVLSRPPASPGRALASGLFLWLAMLAIAEVML
jgi:hypothetical protein